MAGTDAAYWIKAAERAARSFRAATRGEPGAAHSVYVVLLHDPSRGGRWGLYLGQPARDPDWRLDQHMSGYKASGAVRRHGFRLLPDLVGHLNPMRCWESIEIEAALARRSSTRESRGSRVVTERAAKDPRRSGRRAG